MSLALLTPHPYNPVSSISSLISPHSSSPHTVPATYYDEPEAYGEIGVNTSTPMQPQPRRASATLLMLARNSDVDNAVRSVREMEDRFNRKYRYPWVFLNEEPFSDDFKRCVPSPAVLSLLNLCSMCSRLPCLHPYAQTVACRFLSRAPCILGRSPRSIGIHLRGSTRLGRQRREIRWKRRVSYTVAVYRAAFVFFCSISMIKSVGTGIAICAGSTRGSV